MGTGEYYFSCSADHEQDWQPYPVDPYSAICDDHTYTHTYIHTYKQISSLAQGPGNLYSSSTTAVASHIIYRVFVVLVLGTTLPVVSDQISSKIEKRRFWPPTPRQQPTIRAAFATSELQYSAPYK